MRYGSKGTNYKAIDNEEKRQKIYTRINTNICRV